MQPPGPTHIAAGCAGLIVLCQMLNGLYNPILLRSSVAAYWAMDVLVFTILPLVGILALARSPSGFSEFSIEIPKSSVDWFDLLVLSAFLTALQLLIYVEGTALAYASLNTERPAAYFAQSIPNDPVLKPVVGFYSALTAGLAEEWTYKGAIYYLLHVREPSPYSRFAFVLIAPLLFGLIHWENGPAEMIGAFAMCAVGSLLFLKVLNVIPFILAHAVIDIWHFT